LRIPPKTGLSSLIV